MQIQATHLTAYIDQQSIEIFVNDGQEVLTSVFYIEGTKKVYSQI
ncbi:GH32 C-terminal domain-containing protein [Enterococcus cecorum]|nr:GH32 C-terminal domain-containing protein [Enterococcus cecorum]